MPTGAIIIEDRVRIPADVFDLPRFRDWAHSNAFPETGKISYIRGEVEVDMSPEELNSHNRVKRDVSTDLNVLVRQWDVGEMFVDGALLINELADLSTEPDFLFCSWKAIQAERVVFAPWGSASDRLVEVQGTPDLVGEIISANSVRKDTVLLRRSYFEAGIPEYWLIDARGDKLTFQILVRGKSGYMAAKTDAEGFNKSKVLRHRFKIVRLKNRIGGNCYRLLHK